jgi:DNA-binding CsgD family transcriptional regulator
MLQYENAAKTIQKLKEVAHSVQIWPWYFLASAKLLRLEVSQGIVHQGIDIIRELQLKLSTFTFTHEMEWMTDSSEISLRAAINDLPRLKELMLRAPRIDLIREIEITHENLLEVKERIVSVEVLPEKTIRQKVEKLVYQSIVFSGNETLALQNLGNALDIGAEVGFYDFFIRHKNLYPIMVKAAVAKPTVFREGLVRAMGQQINAKGGVQGSLAEKLTRREVEILKHLGTGVPISSISKKLHISQNTMKTHLRNLYRKLDVDGRHSAVDEAKKLLLI